MNDLVHVFVGSFESRDVACEYTEPQYEAEPDGNATDQEYKAWEDRNPSWEMNSDLGVYLDPDFIETLHADDGFDFLASTLTEESALDRIRAISGDNYNFLVLIFSAALGGFAAEMKSTPHLKYCGEFACDLRRGDSVREAQLGAIPDRVRLALEASGTVFFAGEEVNEVEIDSRGLVVGRGSARGNAVRDQPYLDLLPLAETDAVAPVQLRIYRDPFDQWVVEDHGNNGLTSVRGAVLNGERSMPWHNNRIGVGRVVFLWKCLEGEESV
jgi:phytoene dehydrogenase-like protein